MFVAWLTGSNIIAALVAGALHDVILPFMPVIYRFEYDLGEFLIHSPHRWPPPLARMPWKGHEWRTWTTFFTVGKSLLLGSAICATPFTIVSYFVTRGIMARHRKRSSPIRWRLFSAAPI